MCKKGWAMGLVCSALSVSALVFSVPVKAQVPETSEQAVVVLTPTWTSVTGRLQRFERRSQGPWQRVGAAIPIVVGKKGLGWGRGLFTLSEPMPDYRQEGDKRAPAGIFRLSHVFGLATDQQARQWLSLRMPYIHLHEHIRCIGDATSEHYNTMLDLRTVTKD